MSEIVNPAIEKYCIEHTTPLQALFDELKNETHAKTSAPQMQVGRLEGAFLKLLIGLTHAQTVLEFGTFTGYSSMAMAEALPPNGKVITFDIDPKATSIARAFWAKNPHGGKIELRLGPGLESIRGVEGPIDLVFIDADKANYINYWEASLPKIRTGGLVVVDNVLWNGAVLKPIDKSDHSIVAFNEHAKKDARVEIVMLPVRDGMLLARKK